MAPARLLALALALVAAHGSARAGYLDRSISRAETGARLAAVLGEVGARAQAWRERRGPRPVVVFDIDDTLIRHHERGRLSAMEGAPRYLRELRERGALIVYLTARPARKERETRELLARYRFPLHHDVELLLNTGKADQYAWKREASGRVRAMGFPVALFDNDKRHVRTYRAEFPASRVFRLNTRSSSEDPGGKGLFEVIDGYFR
jgi:hypothetical protein